MLEKLMRTLQISACAAFAITTLLTVAWGAPPAPPVIASVPSVPVGGPEVSIATALGVAAYGLWKSRP